MRALQLLSTALVGGLLLTLAACSGTPTYNPTTVQATVDEERMANARVRTVVIPHVNLGTPSRSYLDKHAARIDSLVAEYLKENGYKVLPQRNFQQHWNTAVRAYGDPVDPTTGRVNMKTFAQIMQSIRDRMKDDGLDAFVFTDLVELEVPFNGGLKHLGRWDGVTRKPAVQGPGEGVSVDFDWNANVAVASLQVSIYDMELQRLFAGRGGLDATDAIDTRSGSYARRRNMLENESYLVEGVQLALHPFIEMENWPGNPD